MESQDFQHIATAVRPMLMNLCRSFFDRPVIGFAASLVEEQAYDVEDAVQETLMRLWQMRDRIGDYQKPEALAMLIAKNVCIDILKLSKEQHEPLDETTPLVGGAQADQLVMTHDTERLIGNALAKLPATQRRMLMMRSEGMSMVEIAAACGATPASAKTMICAARKRMIGLLKIASAATAVILAFFLLTSKQGDDVPNQPQVASVIKEPQRQESVTEHAPQTTRRPNTQTPRQPRRKSRRKAPAITEQQVSSMMAAANYTNEQVESYRIQPVGDAAIVTKMLPDGTTSSYIVCQSNDNEGLHVVPINIEM